MEWVDDAIVLGARPFGEGKLVAEVFAREHGRFGGVVHAGRKSTPILQSGMSCIVAGRPGLRSSLDFFSRWSWSSHMRRGCLMIRLRWRVCRRLSRLFVARRRS